MAQLTKRVILRVSQEEFDFIETAKKTLNCGRSEAVRKILTAYRMLIERPFAEVIKPFDQLAKEDEERKEPGGEKT